MAKHLLFFAVGALALTACTSEDVVDDVMASRNYIQFENVVDKHSRAEELTSNTLKQFNVFGFYTMPADPSVAHAVFNDDPVTYQGGNWTYTVDKRYWVPGAQYYFYAYSCGNTSALSESFGKFTLDMAGNKDVDKRTLEIDNYICDNTHQHDLLFASNTGIEGKESGNDYVAFQFHHALSKIKARFTSTFPSEYDVRIKDVSFRSIRFTGDYAFSDGWKNVAGKEGEEHFVNLDCKGTKEGSEEVTDYIEVSNKKVGGKQMFVDTQTAFVLPFDYFAENGGEEATVKEVFIKFTIEVYYNNNKVMTKVLTGHFNPTWLEGYSYVYNVEMSGTTTNMEVITFTTATDSNGNFIDAWQVDETPVIKTDDK